MAKDYAKNFYNSIKWKKCREGFMQSKNYICEMCNGASYICHHIKHITESNIDNVEVTLNWDNLMSLCLTCHNVIHGQGQGSSLRAGLGFDDEGNIIKNN